MKTIFRYSAILFVMLLMVLFMPILSMADNPPGQVSFFAYGRGGYPGYGMGTSADGTHMGVMFNPTGASDIWGLGFANDMRSIATPVLVWSSQTLVGIGTANPAYRLDVAGDIRSTGTIYGSGTGMTGVVLKTGDTMSGPLTVASSVTVTGASGVLSSVSSPSSTTIRITNTTNDSTWFDGEYYGGLEFYGSDSSGIGAGVKGAIRAYEYGGATTGGPGRLGFFVAGDANDRQGMTLAQSGAGSYLLGVATNVPAYTLDVYGDSRVTGQSIVGGTMTVQGNAFSVGGSTLVVLGGKVTIAGVANNPTKIFEVLGGTVSFSSNIGVPSNYSQFNIRNFATTVDGVVASIQGPSGGASKLHFTDAANYNFSMGTFADTTGDFVFNSGGGGGAAGTERMRIMQSGNVGIGTTAPAEELHVQGPDNTIVISSGASRGIFRAYTASPSFLSMENWETGAATVLFGSAAGGWSTVYTTAGGNGLKIGTLGATPLVLGTNNTAELVINSGGATTGGALCLNASKVLTKCTSAVDASGNCTCP